MVKREQPEGMSPERKKQARHQDAQAQEDQERQAQREEARRAVEAGERPWEEDAGIQAIMRAVEDVEFPTTREDLERSDVGERRVHISKDEEVPLRDVVRKIGGGNYDSPSHFKRTLTQNWTAVESIERAQQPGEETEEPTP